MAICSPLKVLLTCEHASNAIPAPYQHLFAAQQLILSSHQGYDLGAKEIFDSLRPYADFSLAGQYSRLLIDLNRSLHHPHLFSVFTKSLSPEKQKEIISNYYFPYRHTIEDWTQTAVKQQQKIIHISIHSFTPQLGNQIRTNQIGLLFDSGRSTERAWCEIWKKQLIKLMPSWQIRFNYPYLGKADGLTSFLRKTLPAENYIGIELEMNQQIFAYADKWQQLQQVIPLSIHNLLEEWTGFR